MTLPGRKPKPEPPPEGWLVTTTTPVTYLYPPSHRPDVDPVVIERTTPVEPDWTEVFPTPTRRRQLALRGSAHRRPVDTAEDLDARNKRSRSVAHQTWELIIPDLAAAGLLARCDALALKDLCIVVARIDQCEREISVHGLLLLGRDGGTVKSPASTQVKAYRDQFNRLLPEFGLSPSARTRLRSIDFLTDEGDGLFDF